MIQEFKIVEIQKNHTTVKRYIYKFKMNDETFYSYFFLDTTYSEIEFFDRFYADTNVDNKEPVGTFSIDILKKFKPFILSSKEIRLKHLFSPFSFYADKTSDSI